MQYLNKFYKTNIKYELLNKFSFSNTKNFTKLKKITLNFGCLKADFRQLISSLLALELISNQRGNFTKTKFPNLTFKVKKGNPTGCKVTLRNSQLLNFLIKIIDDIIPQLKNFNGFQVKSDMILNCFSYELQETFLFPELEKHYYLFNSISKLNITISTDALTKVELFYLLHSLKFIIKNNKCKYNSIGRV